MTAFQQTRRIFVVICSIALARSLWLYQSEISSWYLEPLRDYHQSTRQDPDSAGRRYGFNLSFDQLNHTDFVNGTSAHPAEVSHASNVNSWLGAQSSHEINQTAADIATQGSPHLTPHNYTHNQTHVKQLLLTPNDSIYPPKKWPNISTTPIVLHDHKLVLFTTEKIGSTVLKQLCRRMEGHANYDYHGGGVPHMYPKNGLKYLNLYELEEANSMLTDDGSEGSGGWTRAMFVRDPKERVLSGYLMWVPGISLPSKKIMEMAQDGLLHKLLGIHPDEIAVNKTNNSSNGFTKSLSWKNLNNMTSAEFDALGFTRPSAKQTLGECCKGLSQDDLNWEILCLRHIKSFSGFLDMIQNGAEDNIPEANSTDSSLKDIKNITLDASFNKTEYLRSYFQQTLRNSPPCKNKHWTPITPWRMEQKFYPQLNFIGHLETAHWDIHRLLDRVSSGAWNEYGASGWGANRNESMFQSSSTVNHAKKSENYLNEYYSSEEIERRVERIFRVDYENEYLDLEVVPIGEAGEFYRRRFLERWGDKYEWIEADFDH